MALDRIGPAPVETSRRHVAVAAKARHDGSLAFLNDEKSADQPQEHYDDGDNADTDAGAAHIGLETAARIAAASAAFLAELPDQTLIEIAPELIELRRAVGRPLPFLLLMLLVVLRSATPAMIILRKLQSGGGGGRGGRAGAGRRGGGGGGRGGGGGAGGGGAGGGGGGGTARGRRASHW